MKQQFATSLGTAVVRIRRAETETAPDGAGPPWLLLHGAAGSWRTFKALQAADGFPHDVDTVIPDLPGWGDSPGIGEFTIAEQARAVVEVMTAAGYPRWRILGHSMGGVLALELAAAEPERTLAVVVLSPTALTTVQALKHPVRNLRTMAPLVGMRVLMGALHRVGRLEQPLVRAARRLGLIRPLLGPFFTNPSSLPQCVFDDLALDARPAAFVAAVQALRSYEFSHWSGITARPLLLRGDRDIFTPERELKELASRIPGARTAAIQGTGHFAHTERPAEIAAILAAEEAR